MARDCRYRMKYPICSDPGLPAAHKVGGEVCHPPKRVNPKKQKMTTSDAVLTQKIEVVATQSTIPSQTTPSVPTEYMTADAGGMAWEEANNSTINDTNTPV